MTQKERLLRILARHVREERDRLLEDVPFILTVIDRWQRAHGAPIIDPNE